MPPRLLTAVIVAFWLAMLGLFLYGDLWPRLTPTEPLMFPVDVVDEAGRQVESWSFAVTDQVPPPKDPIEWPYRAELEWSYRDQNDSFESKCQIADINLVSYYRLTRGGEMTEIETTRRGSPQGAEKAVLVQAQLKGSPHNGRFIPLVERTFPKPPDGVTSWPGTGHDSAHTGEAVAVSKRGTVVDPLHPPRRFCDLSAGQTWKMTVIDSVRLRKLVRSANGPEGDPVSDAEVADCARAYVLEAEVLPQVEEFAWPSEKEGRVSCWIVRCSSDPPDRSLTYKVRQHDGSQSRPGYRAGDVMKLEVKLDGETWNFHNLGPEHRMRSPNRPKNIP